MSGLDVWFSNFKRCTCVLQTMDTQNALQTQHMKIVESQETNNCRIDVLEYQKLTGLHHSAAEMFYRERQGITLKTLRATLNSGKIIAEPGALQFMHGAVDMSTQSGGGVGGFLQRAVTAGLTGETVIKTEFSGTGTVFFEPTWAHYLMLSGNNLNLVTDRGAFILAAGDFKFAAKKPDSILGNLASGEGMFQTSIQGSGILVLNSPVPLAEILTIDLKQEKLVVDGNYVLARTSGIRMTVQRSSKSLLSSATSGEGLVTVFEGSGRVWLIPTLRLYSFLGQV